MQRLPRAGRSVTGHPLRQPPVLAPPTGVYGVVPPHRCRHLGTDGWVSQRRGSRHPRVEAAFYGCTQSAIPRARGGRTGICGRYKFRKIKRRRAAGSWARPTGRNPSLSRAHAGATSWPARHAGAPVRSGGCQASRLTHTAATGLTSTGQATHPTVAAVAALPRTVCVYAPVAAPERGPWPAWASHADECVVVGWPQRAVAVRHPTPSAEAQSGGPGGATGVSSR